VTQSLPDKLRINVRFFAALSERLGCSATEVEVPAGATIASVWAAVSSEPLPANVLVARNMEYSQPDQAVENGDEIAFFPPVTGGGR